jgi:hypothetical protein
MGVLDTMGKKGTMGIIIEKERMIIVLMAGCKHQSFPCVSMARS